MYRLPKSAKTNSSNRKKRNAMNDLNKNKNIKTSHSSFLFWGKIQTNKLLEINKTEDLNVKGVNTSRFLFSLQNEFHKMQ